MNERGAAKGEVDEKDIEVILNLLVADEKVERRAARKSTVGKVFLFFRRINRFVICVRAPIIGRTSRSDAGSALRCKAWGRYRASRVRFYIKNESVYLSRKAVQILLPRVGSEPQNVCVFERLAEQINFL